MNPYSYEPQTVKKWTAVIFDLDDTLYPERDFIRSGFQAVAYLASQEFSLPADVTFAEFQSIFSTGNRADVFGTWLREKHFDPKWLPQFVDTYRFHQPNIHLPHDIAGLLPRLKRVCQLGLVSDGIARSQRAKFAALGLTTYIPLPIFTDELGPNRAFWKPHILPFQTVLQSLDCSAREAVYVADNPHKDFTAPRQLGMHTIRVRWTGGLHSEVDFADNSKNADQEVRCMKELEPLLLSPF